jgi:hypothetical protein
LIFSRFTEFKNYFFIHFFCFSPEKSLEIAHCSTSAKECDTERQVGSGRSQYTAMAPQHLGTFYKKSKIAVDIFRIK